MKKHGNKLLMFCLLSMPLRAQTDSGLVLHSDTRLVEIDVTVRDSAGKPVENLQQSDFTIFDNGKPRPFTIFSANRSGGQETLGQPQPAEVQSVLPSLSPGVFTNTSGSSAAPPEQHSTVILIDGINGYFESFAKGAQGVQGLMEKLPAGERVAVYATRQYEGLLQLVDYTTDRELIRKTIANYIPSGMYAEPLPPEDADDRGMDPEVPPEIRDLMKGRMSPQEIAYTINRASEVTRSVFDTIAQQLRSIPGRKSILWLTQGLPARLMRDPGTWGKTIERLNDANVAVNTVDDDGLGGALRLWGGGDIISEQMLAKWTGGQAFFHRNDLDGAMAESIANSRTDYTLGFYLGDLDGEYHELKVKVDRKGLELNHRLGYIAKADATHDRENRKTELESVLMNPLNLTELGITAKIEHKDGNLEIHLQISPESLTLRQAGGAWNGKVEELFVENNGSKELASVRQMETFHIKPEGKADYDRRGKILTQTMRAVAGATKLVVVIRDSATGRTGSLNIPLI